MASVKISRAGKVIGEYDEMEILELVQDGTVKSTDYYWADDSGDWREVFTRDWPRREHKASAAHPASDSNESAVRKPRRGHSVGICCPECGSANVKKARAIYEQGTVNWSSSGYSQRVTGGATAFRSGRSSSSRGTRQSVLAERMTPPSGGWPGCATSIVVITLIASLFIGIRTLLTEGIVALPGLILFSLLGFWYFNSDWYKQGAALEQKQEEDYDRTWHCMKCGSSFIELPDAPK